MPNQDQDLYGDDGASTAVAERPGDTSSESESEEKPSEEKTTLVNQDIAPGLEVGDEFVAKVTAVHESEYSIAKVEEPKDEEGPRDDRPPPPPPGGESTGSMFE